MIQDRYTLLWQWYMTTTYDNTSWDIWFLHILTLHVITSFWGESSSSDTVARGHPGLLRVGSRTKFRFAKLACQLGLAVQDRRAAAGVVLGQPQLQELFSYLEAGLCRAESLAKQSLGFPGCRLTPFSVAGTARFRGRIRMDPLCWTQTPLSCLRAVRLAMQLRHYGEVARKEGMSKWCQGNLARRCIGGFQEIWPNCCKVALSWKPQWLHQHNQRVWNIVKHTCKIVKTLVMRRCKRRSKRRSLTVAKLIQASQVFDQKGRWLANSVQDIGWE